jgi:hypothetical protein
VRRNDEPIVNDDRESMVQWLPHRRMGANQQMRWSPRGAHRMLKARTTAAYGTLNEGDVTVGPPAAPPSSIRPPGSGRLDATVLSTEGR